MENVLDTFIGEDVPVKVYWDYEEAERQTHDHPGCPDAIIINAVEVSGNDLQEELTDKCIDTLIDRCRDWLNEQWAAQYEQEQQER
jgi:hypothetical protein